MSTRFRRCLTALLPFATAMLAASPSFAGTWSALNKDYGGNLGMILFTPTTPAASPAILVALHYCGGNSSNAKGWFDSAADKNGFYIIAPDAGGGTDVCFDASLGRSGERADVVKMVQWVIDTKKADKNRVFAAGYSSGGCMVNTLLAIYPDVFAGGSAMPGVAAGGWPSGKSCPCGATWSTQTNPTDGKFWGDKARAVFQWSGQRPCVQQWVGEGDALGFYKWLPTVVAQFRDLGGLGAEAAGTGAPSGWTRKVYKDDNGNVRLETNSKPNQEHNLLQQGLNDAVISFLGLDKATGACGITTIGSGGTGGAGGGTSGGGAANGGGTSAQGGASVTTGGTTSNSGGKTGAGGATINSGGSANGGVTSNGGATSLAGGSTNTGSGGSPSSGGSTNGSGGSSNTTFGGNAAKGGSTSASGASNASGGSSAGSGGGSNDSGCGCSVVGTQSGRSLGALVGLTAALGALVRRRRRHAG